MRQLSSRFLATALLAVISGQAAAALAAPGALLEKAALENAPEGASAFRIVYTSQTPDGREVPVSGMVIMPAGPAPEGGRPVVAWAHPTTGVIAACAPSHSPLRFLMIPGLKDLLKKGYVVASTDYPVDAASGAQYFLNGVAEARATLDAVRAARQIPEAGAGTRFALWGHSQGGQAVLFAASLQPDYAPELHLAGVAAAAPATDLATLFRDDIGTNGGNNLTALALWSWARTEGAPFDQIVQPDARPAIETIAAKCIDVLIPSRAKKAADQTLAGGFLTVKDITRVQPWQAIIERNSVKPLSPEVPLLLAQGGADVVVRPDVTMAFGARQCRAGSRVTLISLPTVGHGWIASKSSGQVVDWIADRFAGKPVPACNAPSLGR